MRKVIIIGAGPAGLAAGYKLCEQKIKPLILEKNSAVGGLSRTIKYKGYYFDIGGHRFFTKNQYVLKWWLEILKDDFKKTPRHSKIFYNGKLFNYPISVRNVIANLGVFNSIPIFFSYLKSRLFPAQDEESFDKWVTNRFGNRLFQVFFKNYTEKIWGIPCSQISSDWAAQRIKGLSLSAAVRNALLKDKKNSVKTLVREFYYPSLGAGMMYEAAAEKIIKNAGTIKLNSEVVEIRHKNNKITGLICRNTADGSLFEIEGEDFCSSMPLTTLVAQLKPSPNGDVLKSCRRLSYRSLLLVYLIIDKKELFKDNWLYVHSHDLKVGRIQNYKNWSSDMLGDPNKSSLGLEYFCDEGDLMWRKTDAEAIELAASELERLKITERKDILDAFVLRVPYAYPTYEKNYLRQLLVIKDFIGRFSNLQCMGRGGTFRYNNMDHSILSGFLAAENIAGFKNDLWNVNTEIYYHEEF